MSSNSNLTGELLIICQKVKLKDLQFSTAMQRGSHFDTSDLRHRLTIRHFSFSVPAWLKCWPSQSTFLFALPCSAPLWPFIQEGHILWGQHTLVGSIQGLFQWHDSGMIFFNKTADIPYRRHPCYLTCSNTCGEPWTPVWQALESHKLGTPWARTIRNLFYTVARAIWNWSIPKRKGSESGNCIFYLGRMILDAIRLVSSCLNSKGVTSLEPSSSNTVKQLFTSGEKVNMGSPPSQSFTYSSNHRKSRIVSLIAYDCGRVRTGDHRTIMTSNAKLGTLPNCSTAQPRNSKRASPADGSTSWRVRAPLRKHKVTWHIMASCTSSITEFSHLLLGACQERTRRLRCQKLSASCVTAEWTRRVREGGLRLEHPPCTRSLCKHLETRPMCTGCHLSCC